MSAELGQKFAVMLSAVLIIAFIPNWLPFLFPIFSDSILIWPIFYYSFMVAAGGTTILYFVFDKNIRTKVMPLACLCVVSLLPLIFDTSGHIWKNYFVAIYLLFCLTVLILASGVLNLVRLAASISAFNAVLCLVASAFPDNFTNTIGRTTGLHLNPNVCAVSLLLGAIVTVWAVPKKLQLPYLVLMGSALIPPLSRTVMISAAILAVVAFPLLLQRWKSDHVQLRNDLKRSGVFALVLLVWLMVSYGMNYRFRVALDSASFGLDNFVSKSFSNLDGKSLDNLDGKTLGKLEKESSALARTFLLMRSFRIYQTGPPYGQGIEIAHRLQPHNSFLLFAVAFGYFGWLIVFLFIGLSFYYNRGLKGAIFALAITLTAFFSHDIFLMPGLIVLIAVGYVGLITQDEKLLDRNIEVDRSLGRIIIVGGTLAILGLLALSSTRSTLEVTLEKSKIRAMEGNIYYYLLERPSFSGIFRVKNNHLALKKNSDEEKILFTDNQSGVKGGTNWTDRSGTAELAHFWRYRRRGLMFTTIDGSDPRTNMRKYHAAVPIEIHPLFYFLLLLTLAWMIMSARWLGMPLQQNKG